MELHSNNYNQVRLILILGLLIMLINSVGLILWAMGIGLIYNNLNIFSETDVGIRLTLVGMSFLVFFSLIAILTAYLLVPKITKEMKLSKQLSTKTKLSLWYMYYWLGLVLMLIDISLLVNLRHLLSITTLQIVYVLSSITVLCLSLYAFLKHLLGVF